MKTNIGYKMKGKYEFKRERLSFKVISILSFKAIRLSFENLWEKIFDSGKAVGGSVVTM